MVRTLLTLLICLLAWPSTAQQYRGRRMHPAVATILFTNTVTDNATEYVTSSVTSSSWRVLTVFTQTSDGVLPDAHSITSLHGTWTQVANVNFHTIAVPIRRGSFWYVIPTNAISSTITNKFNNGATGSGFVVAKFDGMKTTTAVIGSSATTALDASTSITVTLATITNKNNAVFYGAGKGGANPYGGTPEAGFTVDLDSGWATPAVGIFAMHQLNTIDNTPNSTTASGNLGAIAVELVAQ